MYAHPIIDCRTDKRKDLNQVAMCSRGTEDWQSTVQTKKSSVGGFQSCNIGIAECEQKKIEEGNVCDITFRTVLKVGRFVINVGVINMFGL